MKLKLNEFKKLIREEIYQHQINRLNENILRSIWALLLTPKVNKAIDKYKNEPEYKELEQQIKMSAKNLTMIADRLKDAVAKRQALITKMNDEGIKISTNMTAEEMLARLPNVSEKEIRQLAKKLRK